MLGCVGDSQLEKQSSNQIVLLAFRSSPGAKVKRLLNKRTSHVNKRVLSTTVLFFVAVAVEAAVGQPAGPKKSRQLIIIQTRINKFISLLLT